MKCPSRFGCSTRVLLVLLASLGAPSAETLAGGSAQITVYHLCNGFSVITGGAFSGADGRLEVGNKPVGRTPVCSVRTFAVPSGTQPVHVRDWAGLSFNWTSRTLPLAPGHTAHVVVTKGAGGAFQWYQVSAAEGQALARDIRSVKR